jgi:hypothetical protein
MTMKVPVEVVVRTAVSTGTFMIGMGAARFALRLRDVAAGGGDQTGDDRDRRVGDEQDGAGGGGEQRAGIGFGCGSPGGSEN